MNLTEIEKAYIAGYVDADGCITLQKAKSKRFPTALITVVGANSEAMEWMHKKIGFGTMYYAKQGKDPENWRPVHRYQATSTKASILAKEIYPYIIAKKRQCEILINHPARGIHFSKSCPDHLVEEAWNNWKIMRGLNWRGTAKRPDFEVPDYDSEASTRQSLKTYTASDSIIASGCHEVGGDYPVTRRKDAIEKGEVHYFTGRPCRVSGKYALRISSAGMCLCNKCKIKRKAYRKPRS